MGRPTLDMVGQKFNNWTVIKRDDKIGQFAQVYWFCRCDCGTERAVMGPNLRGGKSKSCGCVYERPLHRNPRDIDLTSKVVGRWTILHRTSNLGEKVAWWCRCDCGTERAVMHTNLIAERSMSCGCLQKERASDSVLAHGLTNHPVYKAWRGMKNRCRNPNSKDYRHYGGRGITYHPSWEDFKVFWQDTHETWQPKLELDRIDVNGNYEPGNVRWATRQEQMLNTRRAVLVVAPNGETMTAVEAGERYNIPVQRLRNRHYAGKTGRDLFKEYVGDFA